jgi:hypothetical protein
MYYKYALMGRRGGISTYINGGIILRDQGGNMRKRGQ